MISVPHPIRLLITNQYQFLSSMFNRFPSLLNNWIDQQEKEVNKLANIESGGGILKSIVLYIIQKYHV